MFGHFPLLSQSTLLCEVFCAAVVFVLVFEEGGVFFPPPSQTRCSLHVEVLQVQIQTAHLPTHLHSMIIPANALQIKAARVEIWQARMPPVTKSTVEVTNRNLMASPYTG
jgi:hypothetical protein